MIILTNGNNNGWIMMKMAKTTMPKLMQLFTNLLWVNSPKNWILKSTYFQGTLYISMLIDTYDDKPYKKIHRSFGFDTVSNRAEDILGLAADCIDEMKTET